MDEAVGRARQHVARPGRRPRGALAEALRAGAIFGRGARRHRPGADPADHPLVGLDNCLIVPHIASASLATRAKMAEMAAANLLAGLRGERLPTPVNPEVYR